MARASPDFLGHGREPVAAGLSGRSSRPPRPSSAGRLMKSHLMLSTESPLSVAGGACSASQPVAICGRIRAPSGPRGIPSQSGGGGGDMPPLALPGSTRETPRSLPPRHRILQRTRCAGARARTTGSARASAARPPAGFPPFLSCRRLPQPFLGDMGREHARSNEEHGKAPGQCWTCRERLAAGAGTCLGLLGTATSHKGAFKKSSYLHSFTWMDPLRRCPGISSAASPCPFWTSRKGAQPQLCRLLLILE